MGMAETAPRERRGFARTGTNEVNTPTYMMIQDPTLIIELLSKGGSVHSGHGHYHTIYRNPNLEYVGVDS